MILDYFFFYLAKIYGWDIPEHGNAAAPNPLPENTHSVTDILMVMSYIT